MKNLFLFLTVIFFTSYTFASNGSLNPIYTLSFDTNYKVEKELFDRKYDDTKVYICCAESVTTNIQYCAFANSAGEACSKAAQLANEN